MTISDQAQRDRALDTTKSFIVQAPAGSGKTELLIHRYLALLAETVKEPEEVIAITFTRKAAAEMRTRVIESLHAASANDYKTKDSCQQKRFSLARQVLKQDIKYEWNILDNPNRLSIQTIDSLCTKIVAKTPILSSFGSQPKIVDDVSKFYSMAARDVLLTLGDNTPWSAALEKVLLHIDNDHLKAQRLFVDMLQCREQWLPYILQRKPRDVLEGALDNIVEEQIGKIKECFPISLIGDIEELIHFVTLNLNGKQQLFSRDSRDYWLMVCDLLLTKDNVWRKRFTSREGFPSISSTTISADRTLFKNMKSKVRAIVDGLSADDVLREQLTNVRELPSETYSDEQWEIIEALVILLPVLAGQLNVLFKQYDVVDHTEISLRSLTALGNIGTPTDLALSLDYKIKHILVDEFQDTSLNQYRILELLTAGWEPNDLRTLFLVGDPMQSIYRFRKAEVGLFIQAREQGVGSIALQSLVLSVNFRSTEDIIKWINSHCSSIFPKEDDLATNAVCFSKSVPQKSSTSECKEKVKIYPSVNGDADEEASQIVSIINDIRSEAPHKKIAILTLARSHLEHIIPAIQNANIDYKAVEIERLFNKVIIQDLLSLTKALLSPANRVAWLSILRAPWCGLTLADLHVLTKHAEGLTILDVARDLDNLSLSEHGKTRLKCLIKIMQTSYKQRQRTSVANWIESTWLAIGGPACINQVEELEYANVYFKLVSEMERGGNIEDIDLLETNLNKLTGTSFPKGDNPVEIMTIHKAKGLEFDVVILPGLERQTKSDSHKLLMLEERTTSTMQSELLFAPIKTTDSNKIYDYLRNQENKRAYFETQRLLYVALTRAKNELHLLGNVRQVEDEIIPPQRGAMLGHLWPVLKERYHACGQDDKHNERCGLNEQEPNRMTRLTSDWKNSFVQDMGQELVRNRTLGVKKFKYKDNKRRYIGTAIHNVLHHICSKGVVNWSHMSQSSKQKGYEFLLRDLNLVKSDLDEAIVIVNDAIENTLSDPRGRWIIDNSHKDSRSEYAISTLVDGVSKQLVIDRTFIDDDIRWVVDYKTSHNKDDDLEKFLKREFDKYREQLERYAKALSEFDGKKTRLGLYFPLVPAWYEWDCDT